MQKAVISIALVFLLLGCGRSTDKALVQAAAKGDIKIVEHLLSEGADIEAEAFDGWTPLTIAASEGQRAVVEHLIQHGALVDGRDAAGNTALFWAAYDGHGEIVRFLLKNGANPARVTPEGRDGLLRALRKMGRTDMVVLIP
jgi:ankyrin repeat protein